MYSASYYLGAWRSAKRAITSDSESEHFLLVENSLLSAPMRSANDALAVLEVKIDQYNDDPLLVAAIRRVGVVA